MWIVLNLWIIYCIFEGAREAFYWNTYPTYDFNIHWMFFVTRAIFLAVASDLLWQIIVSFALMFSFIHNGAYYTTRNILNRDLYKKKWFDQSTTSTAFLTKFNGPVSRTIQFILGATLFLLFKLGIV
jgi:hypothetical protein